MMRMNWYRRRTLRLLDSLVSVAPFRGSRIKALGAHLVARPGLLIRRQLPYLLPHDVPNHFFIQRRALELRGLVAPSRAVVVDTPR